jgi:uncharacterized membrane protein YqjE
VARKNNDGSIPKPGLIGKIFGPIKILLTLHLRLAGKELKKDVRRFFAGIISIIIGIFFLIIFLILLNVLIVLSLREFFHLSIFYSVLIVTSFNILLSIIFLGAGSSSLKKPFFTETKRAIKQTFKEFK